MMRDLSDTLIELVSAVYAPDAAVPVAVESMTLELPLRVRLETTTDGLRVLASPAETVYRTGIEPRVHPVRMTAVGTPTLPPEQDDGGIN